MFDIPLSSLGPWPIVQFAVAVMILAGGVYALRRGEKDKKDSGADQLETERQELRDQVAAALMRDAGTRIRDDLIKILEANREAFFREIHLLDNRQTERTTKLGDRIHEIEIKFAGFEAQRRLQ